VGSLTLRPPLWPLEMSPLFTRWKETIVLVERSCGTLYCRNPAWQKLLSVPLGKVIFGYRLVTSLLMLYDSNNIIIQ
jgi:hypothetical protein